VLERVVINICNKCSFSYPENEYIAEEHMDIEISIDSTKQYFESYLEQDYDFNYYIGICGNLTEIKIPIKYCPECGRKL